MILDPDHNLSLVQPHVGFVEPVFCLIETIVKAIGAPNSTTQLAIEMLERGQRFIGSDWPAQPERYMLAGTARVGDTGVPLKRSRLQVISVRPIMRALAPTHETQ